MTASFCCRTIDHDRRQLKKGRIQHRPEEDQDVHKKWATAEALTIFAFRKLFQYPDRKK